MPLKAAIGLVFAQKGGGGDGATPTLPETAPCCPLILRVLYTVPLAWQSSQKAKRKWNIPRSSAISTPISDLNNNKEQRVGN